MSGRIASTARAARRDAWVLPFLRRYAKAFAAALFLGALALAFSCGLMFTSGYLISASASGVDSIIALHLPIAFVQLFGVGKPILQYFERIRSHDWVLRMTSGMRLALYRVFERRPLGMNPAVRAGEALGLLADDIGHMQNLFVRVALPFAVAYVLWFAVLAVAGFFSLALAAVLMVSIGVAVLIVPLAFALGAAARRERAAALRSSWYADVADDVLGIQDWVCAARRDDFLGRSEHLERELHRIERHDARLGHVRDFLAQVALGLACAVLAAWAIAQFGGTNAEGAGAGAASNWVAAFALVLLPATEAFAALPAAAVGGVDHASAVQRLNRLSSDPDLSQPGAGVRRGDDGRSIELNTANELDEQGGPVLAVRDVAFAYPGGEPVLRSASLVVNKGEKVALIGRSGTGKSTLLSLIRGDLAPQEGCVAVLGKQARELGDEAHRIVGFVQQNPYLMNISLGDNVRIGDPGASDEDVANALERVGLAPLVESLPHGLDEIVDEGGKRFSGGQRQRIALARVLLADAPIVLLDEPMVGLDPATERGILRTMLDVFDDRTVIMATHHLAGARLFDRVVLLDEGSIALDGRPLDLERESERYRELVALESSGLIRD